MPLGEFIERVYDFVLNPEFNYSGKLIVFYLQSVEKPTQKEALSSLFKSRPLMMMALSSLLSRFGLSVDMSTYYTQVLNVSSMDIFVGFGGDMLGVRELWP